MMKDKNVEGIIQAFFQPAFPREDSIERSQRVRWDLQHSDGMVLGQVVSLLRSFWKGADSVSRLVHQQKNRIFQKQ